MHSGLLLRLPPISRSQSESSASRLPVTIELLLQMLLNLKGFVKNPNNILTIFTWTIKLQLSLANLFQLTACTDSSNIFCANNILRVHSLAYMQVGCQIVFGIICFRNKKGRLVIANMSNALAEPISLA